MARRKQTKGNCIFCNREMTSGGLSRHLSSCPKRKEEIAVADNGRSQTLYHLIVKSAYDSDFWLHLEINGRSSLKNLDSYLRAIWLECCGHLSQFSIGGWRGRKIPMSRKIEAVFGDGAELTHIYDFGSSSETLIRMIAAREGRPLTNKPIYLMARNKMPESICDKCDDQSGWYCADCLIERGEWITICEKHCAEHDHGEYGGPTPLINSPRLGMCGYDGPAEPPY